MERTRSGSKRRGVNQMERVRGVKGWEGVIGGERRKGSDGEEEKWE